MAGYIGSKTSVTVTSPETDSRYVNVTGDTISGDITFNGSVTFNGATTGAGGGLFKGENGEVGSSAGDIFRINEQELNTNVTIDSDENASCTGPLTVASGVTLTVNGNLAVI